MKIYILPIDHKCQPMSQPFKYPAHNNDYGVEQDFHKYILVNKELICQEPSEADWHYLPIYWTRWHLNHDYGKKGMEELQLEVNRKILNDSKTFTICQYADGPLVKIGKTIQFLSSRKTDEGIDIPLLSAPHKIPFFRRRKKYLASFVGRFSTHPIRKEIAKKLRDRDDVLINDGDMGSKYFAKILLASHIALSPRGYSGSSFRFFEAMQMGVVPFLMGDIDTRPFKKWIDWDKISFYAELAKGINGVIDAFPIDELLEMGNQTQKVYEEHLTFQKWCPYVLEELKTLSV